MYATPFDLVVCWPSHTVWMLLDDQQVYETMITTAFAHGGTNIWQKSSTLIPTIHFNAANL